MTNTQNYIDQMQSKATTFDNLKQDLTIAFEDGTLYEKSTGAYINSIDPSNMLLLRKIWSEVDGNYSMATLAGSIIKGLKLKY